MVLGIEQVDGTYLGVPQADSIAVPGDVLIVYSRSGILSELDHRRGDDTGEAAHAAAVAEQDRIIAAERSIDLAADAAGDSAAATRGPTDED